MGLHFIVKETPAPEVPTTPPLGSLVFNDPMNDNTYWDEGDPNGYGNFSGGRFVKTLSTWNASIAIWSSNKWYATGTEFDFVAEMDLDGIVGTPPSGLTTYFTFEVTKISGNARLALEADGLGGARWNLINTAGFTPDPWGGSLGTGSYKVRARKNSDNTLTLFVWNGSSWEWNGNPLGITSSTNDWGAGISPRFYMADLNSSSYFQTGADSVSLYGGTFNSGAIPGGGG